MNSQYSQFRTNLALPALTHESLVVQNLHVKSEKRIEAVGWHGILGVMVLVTLTIFMSNLAAGTSPPTLTTLYNFMCCSDGSPSGANPQAGLIFENGVLYGTTTFGGIPGSGCPNACGTVFELEPPAAPGGAWTETVLYRFTGGSDGTNPVAGLVMDRNGALYGTTYGDGYGAGGGLGAGTVFKLTPPTAPGGAWTEAVLYRFTGGSDGANPVAGLVIGNLGAIWGTTSGGGLGAGTVFKLTPPTAPVGAWTEAVLYRFTGGSDGASPQAGLIAEHGALYGTTYSGGLGAGTVFELMPPTARGGTWTETVLYSFTGAASDGGNPTAGLVIGEDGTLYGTTTFSAFKLTPPAEPGDTWTETVLHSFIGNEGGYGQSGLVIAKHGALYGTVSKSVATPWGYVFELTQPAEPGGSWTEAVLYSFTGGPDGGGPDDGGASLAGLVIDKHGALYGTTYTRGSGESGTVFKLIP